MNQDLEKFLKDFVLINLQPTESVYNYFSGNETQIESLNEFEIKFFQLNIQLLKQITANPKGLSEFFHIISKEDSCLTQLQHLRGFFLDILINIQGKEKDNCQFQLDFLCLFRDYLQ